MISENTWKEHMGSRTPSRIRKPGLYILVIVLMYNGLFVWNGQALGLSGQNGFIRSSPAVTDSDNLLQPVSF